MAASVSGRASAAVAGGAAGGGGSGVGGGSLSQRWDAAVARNELLKLARQPRLGLSSSVGGSGGSGVGSGGSTSIGASRDVAGSSSSGIGLRRRPELGLTKSNGHLDSTAEPALSIGGGSNGGGGEETSKIRRGMRSESESNVSQDDVMFFQVELDATRSRLLDMEQQLSRNNEKLMKTEEWLQKEQMTRTYLEAHKLELMSDIVELRNRLQSVEKERSDYREKHERLQKQLYELNHSVQRKDRELAELRGRLAKGGSPLLQGGTGALDNGLMSETEVEKLKAAVERLLSENEIKERKLDELRKAVHKYQKVEEIILQSSAHGSAGLRGLSDAEGDNGSMSSVNDAASAKAYHSSSHKAGSVGQRSDISSFLTAATTAGLSYGDGSIGRGGGVGGSFSTLAGPSLASRAAQAPAIVHRSNSCEALRFNRITPKGAVESPPESRTRGALGGDGVAQTTTYNSLPRDYRNKVNAGGSGGGDGGGAVTAAAGGTRSKDTYDEETSGDDDVGSGKESKKKRSSSSSGLKKIFARLKRSSSSEVVGDGFRRGGVRSTAGPRLGGGSSGSGGGSGAQKSLLREDPGLPFAQWDGNQIADWLHDLGLAMYMPDCRRWVRGGQQLLDASPHTIDKELRMTNALHRKKLLLAIDSMRGSDADLDGGGPKLFTSTALNLRPEWVTRWLDDVGLPQYKDQFFEARVDGRVLNFLTVEDLLTMKITNALHHTSIRRGIEVLRQNDFNMSSLKRRPLPEELADSAVAARAMSPDSVLLWTNHRIMEWLRTIDLSEYAPNLRGSGVHGGVVILEPRFTVDILADLLSIPAAKTLLRRHLASHFASLIGEEAMKKKGETEGNQSLPPLTLNGKVKVKKPALFQKRTLQPMPGIDGELLCPIDDLTPIDIKKEDKKVKDAVAAYKKELTKRDQKKPRENLPRAITDYSQFSQEVRTMAGLMTTSQSPSTKC